MSEMSEKKNKTVEENKKVLKEKLNVQKENVKSTVKSAWKQKVDRNKTLVENRREQWKQFFDYKMEMQDTFLNLFTENTVLSQKLPIAPKDFFGYLKEFQIMANDHFVNQVDSLMDFCFQSQAQFCDMVTEIEKTKKEKAQVNCAE